HLAVPLTASRPAGPRSKWDAEGCDGCGVARDHQPNLRKSGLGWSEGSAFFFFALPLQHGADADAHGALFAKRRFLEAVLVAARPEEQARAGGGAVEVTFTEIAIEALQATHLSGRGRRVLWFGPDLGFCRLDGHSYSTIALVGAPSFGSGGVIGAAASSGRRRHRGGGVMVAAPSSSGAAASFRATASIGQRRHQGGRHSAAAASEPSPCPSVPPALPPEPSATPHERASISTTSIFRTVSSLDCDLMPSLSMVMQNGHALAIVVAPVSSSWSVRFTFTRLLFCSSMNI